MPTSVRDLLDVIADVTAAAPGSSTVADTAVTALGHLGRALDALADQADETSTGRTRRPLVIRELSTACHRAAAQWSTTPGRATDSAAAAAAADAIGTASPHLDPDERWALAIEVAVAAGHAAAFARGYGPYARSPALARVLLATELVGQVARLDAPDSRGRAYLDRPIAAAPVSPRSATYNDVPNAVAALVLAVERSARADTLTMRDTLAVCAAAESGAEHAATAAARLADRPAPQWSRVPNTWRLLQATLMRYDDGSRYAAPSTSNLTEGALALHQAVTADAASLDQLATAVRYLANQLPTIGAQVETAFTQWARAGRLFAKARALPRSEERVSEFIADQAVIVRPPEIGRVLLVARAVQRQSAALAVELDRSAGHIGRQPQPHLIRALAATLPARARTTDRTAAVYALAAAPAPTR